VTAVGICVGAGIGAGVGRRLLRELIGGIRREIVGAIADGPVAATGPVVRAVEDLGVGPSEIELRAAAAVRQEGK
jgi:hypothetical protein